jgi:two-component system, NarL family, sensor histidine kinase DesK
MKGRVPGWLRMAPDSLAAQDVRCGRPWWLPMVHVAWSIWVFMTPAFSGGGSYGYTTRWALLTAVSYPLFLALYAVAVYAAPRRAIAAAAGLVVLCIALLPWYPSGLSYFMFGCVMLQPRRRHSISGYAALLVALNIALVAYARWLGYPWQAVMWMPIGTAIIGMLVVADRINQQREAAMKLSQDEVRRLAALAERERIGRDLHDLLGHTLSMVALKADLAGRLLERDAEAARGEIADVGRVARDALAQVRRAVSGIRAAGITAELASAKLLLESDGVAFEYSLDETFAGSALPAGVETVLAMTVREAATNIQRHARAHRADIRFGVEGGEAVLRIHDNGRGGAIVPGNGLSGMRERIEGMGGWLRIETGTGRGTRLEARVPLAANDDPAATDDGGRSDGIP